MATSGSVDYSRTRDQIVKRALSILGVIEGGETPSAADSVTAIAALNSMVKNWHVFGFKLWKKEEATVFLEPGTSKYSLGSGGAHAAISTVKTELGADAATSATSLTVDSITGISNADNIGIVLDDGTTHWTTVNGTPTGTTVVITSGLASAASTDNHIYTYTTRLDRPLRVMGARRRDEGDQDIPLLMWSRDEYLNTPNKTTQGTPTAIYYDPQTSTGELHVWMNPDSASDRLLIDCDMPTEDFDAASNNPDFPQEWISVLEWGLADELRFDFGVPVEIADRVNASFEKKFHLANAFDSEPESVYFEPDLEDF